MKTFTEYHAYARDRGTYMSLTYCFMRPNWHELGDFLLFADHWDCDVFINTVFAPISLSLHHTPVDELAAIVGRLRHQDAGIRARLTRNRAVWERELARLEHRLQTRQSTGAGAAGNGGGQEMSTYSLTRPFVRSSPASDPDEVDVRARAALDVAGGEEIDELVCTSRTTSCYRAEMGHVADLDLDLRLAGEGPVVYLTDPLVRRRLHGHMATVSEQSSGETADARERLHRACVDHPSLSVRDRSRARTAMASWAARDVAKALVRRRWAVARRQAVVVRAVRAQPGGGPLGERGRVGHGTQP